MAAKRPTRIKAWWAKYRTWLILLLVVYVLVVLVFVLLSGGLRSEPFRYQVF